jgi:hypothetical protein
MVRAAPSSLFTLLITLHRKTSTLSTILASLYPSLPAALQHPATRFAFRTVYFDGRAFGDDRDCGGDKAPPRAWRSRELGRIDARDLVRQLGDIDKYVFPAEVFFLVSFAPFTEPCR